MDDNTQDQQPTMSGDSSMGSPMPTPGSYQPMGGSSDSTGGAPAEQGGMPSPSTTPGDMPMPESGEESGEGGAPQSGDQPPHDPMNALDPHPDASQQG